MKNALNSIKVAAPTTNAFDLSHDVKLSAQMGKLIPVLAMEVVPGDRVRIGCENVVRLAPMLAPMMHLVHVRVEYFFVPNRIVWSDFETWITNGGDNPIEDPPATLPAHPYFWYNDGTVVVPAAIEFVASGLLDYMGLPQPVQGPDPDAPEKISAIPFAAYQKIYDDYYRDENMLEKQFTDLNNGDNTSNEELFMMRKRAWEADYFTKALPFAQKGVPVDMPFNFRDVEVGARIGIVPTSTILDGTPNDVNVVGSTPVDLPVSANDLFAMTSDLSGAATINDLRVAYRLQEWLEKNARGGTRYSEMIRAHFNENPEDSRLQRPEYIVGVKTPIQISEVLNTSGTEDTPQGNMSGHGVSYANGSYGKYHVREHGYIIGILSIMPKTAYQQGIPKHFLKYTDPTQLAWPTFGNLGEQPIENREIMAFQQNNGENIFGYTPRYMEYKALPSRVCGDFRDNLDFWHMGRIFNPLTPPQLNQAFIEADPTTRIFAVTESTDNLYCQCMHHIICVRALPFYGTPTF